MITQYIISSIIRSIENKKKESVFFSFTIILILFPLFMKTWDVIFLLSIELFFNIYSREDLLLLTISVFVCLETVFISPLLLKDNFTGYRILVCLGLFLFFFSLSSTLNISLVSSWLKNFWVEVRCKLIFILDNVFFWRGGFFLDLQFSVVFWTFWTFYNLHITICPHIAW